MIVEIKLISGFKGEIGTMENKEVEINSLVPGEEYYCFSTADFSVNEFFRGTFTRYWNNQVGYRMMEFDNVFRKDNNTMSYILINYRIFEPHLGFRFYPTSRFSHAEKKELLERCVLRERRQYERGLTGSTNKDVWLPRDLVREISLRYLTDSRVGCAGRWR
jgi:hypothetical protein